jgi:hypothetical protein
VLEVQACECVFEHCEGCVVGLRKGTGNGGSRGMRREELQGALKGDKVVVVLFVHAFWCGRKERCTMMVLSALLPVPL